MLLRVGNNLTTRQGYLPIRRCVMGIGSISLNTKRILLLIAAAAFMAALLAFPANAGAEIINGQHKKITVNKIVDTDGDSDFDHGNTVANGLGFRWGLNQETPARNMGSYVNVGPGTYQITEKMVANYEFVGWYEGEGSCRYPEHRVLPASVTVAGYNKTVTLCNKLQPTITVTKQTNPDGDTTPFSITAHTANGKVHGDATRDIHDGEKEVYKVGFGTYTIEEAVPAGWTMTSNTCKNLVVSKEHPAATCEIVNTKNPVGGQGGGVVQGTQTTQPQVAAPVGGVGAGSGSEVTSLGALLGLVGSVGAVGLGLRQARKTL